MCSARCPGGNVAAFSSWPTRKSSVRPSAVRIENPWTDVRLVARTADGRTVDFRVGALENASSFPPGHLAEHKVTLIPVRVTYVEEAGEPVAVRLEDAP